MVFSRGWMRVALGLGLSWAGCEFRRVAPGEDRAFNPPATVPVVVAAPPRSAPTRPPEPASAPSVRFLPGGLVSEDLRAGSGREATAGSEVAVHYVGTLLDGSPVDESRDPFVFRLGEGRVIAGWEQGVPGMKVGGLRKLTIPPALGYGTSGRVGKIPPGAVLVFEIELLEVR